MTSRHMLLQLFDHCVDETWARSSQLHLVGVVCYYGKHYSTFFLHSKLNQWISFDDANVKQVRVDRLIAPHTN